MNHFKIVRVFENLYSKLILDEEDKQIARKMRKLHVVAFIHCLFMIWIMILFGLFAFPSFSPFSIDVVVSCALGGTCFFICIWAYSDVETFKQLHYYLRRQNAFFEHLEELGISFVIHGKRPEFHLTTPGMELNLRALDKYIQYLGEFCNDSLPENAQVELGCSVTVDTYLAFITLAVRLARQARILCWIYAWGILSCIGIVVYVFLPPAGVIDPRPAPGLWFPLNIVLTILGIIGANVFAILYIYEAHWLLYVQIPLGYDLPKKLDQMDRRWNAN